MEPHPRLVRAPHRRELTGPQGLVSDTERFARAVAAIDAGNSDDPNIITVRSRTGPKEIVHAELPEEADTHTAHFH